MTERKTGRGTWRRTPGATRVEVAALVGVSPQRIFQLEMRALNKLRIAIEREADRAGLSVHEWLFG